MNTKKNIPDSNKLIEKITGHFSNLTFVLPSKIGQTAVRDALNKTVLNGGKRIRPYLTYLFSNLCKIGDESLINCLCESIEFVHAASLAHDDVIDNATSRRGNPSINILVGNKKSILAGDYLLANVIEKLCLFNNPKLIKEMANTIRDLSLGEWLQYDLISSRQYQEDSFEKISSLKTSSVLKWCVVGPLIAGGYSEKSIELGRRFGESLGLSFQYSDDILDFKGSSQKDLNLDLKNNQLNIVTYNYLLKNDLMSKFQSGEDLLNLVNISDIEIYVTEVEKMVRENLSVCKNLFSEICDELNVGKLSKEKMAINVLLGQLEKRII